MKIDITIIFITIVDYVGSNIIIVSLPVFVFETEYLSEIKKMIHSNAAAMKMFVATTLCCYSMNNYITSAFTVTNTFSRNILSSKRNNDNDNYQIQEGRRRILSSKQNTVSISSSLLALSSSKINQHYQYVHSKNHLQNYS